MSTLPRIALGTLHPEASSRYISWALLALLRRIETPVRHFYSRACFSPLEGAAVAAGSASRHLDSWLMSPELCREAFAHGACNGHLSVVEGEFWTDPTASAASQSTTELAESCPADESWSRGSCEALCRLCGGRLDVLCQWLLLPRVGVLDVAALDRCRLPERPNVDALVLDRVASASDYYRWQTRLEPLWGIRVLGGLEVMPALRNAVEQLPPGRSPARELLNELANRLSLLTDLKRLRELARSQPFPDIEPQYFRPMGTERPRRRPIRVAVAYDEAFHCYFPDTLDLLELRGAQVTDFSPLKDDSLPDGTDIVYLGCGHPEEFARELGANHCFLTALRTHVCAGRRVYAEGGGLAYLCRQVQLADGRHVPMTGILPVVARRNCQACVRPVEVQLDQACWLGRAGMRLRGYLNSGWTLEPSAQLTCHASDGAHGQALVGRNRAVASRIHLNFACQREVFERFVQGEQPEPAAGQ